MPLDTKALGAELASIVAQHIAPLVERIKALEARQPEVIKGEPGKDGIGIVGASFFQDGTISLARTEGDPIYLGNLKGEKGADGKDGVGMSGAMIDRDGNLMLTMTNGEVKNLGPVVGKDGRDGLDGKDGASLDSFELEYLGESHEISIKATCQGRVKEIRYGAGGIRPAGYWREGTKAKAGEAWVHDGSLWVAMKDCSSKPATNDDGWIIAARKGRDGERGASAKPVDTSPIKLGV